MTTNISQEQGCLYGCGSNGKCGKNFSLVYIPVNRNKSVR